MSVRILRLPTALCLALVLAGCATAPTATRDARDPFEPLNRSVYAFNDGIDKALARPLARGYKAVVPKPVQTGISNAFSNAKYPVTMVNDLLQGKLKAALSDAARFTLNSTLGLGGLLDPATDIGLDRNDEDFGQTLGKWGLPSGPYFVLPFLGPYTLLDGLGSLADDFVQPRAHLEDDSTRWTLWAGDKFDRRVRLLEADAVIDRAGDPYAFVRSAYLQRQEFLIRDGAVPAEPTELEPEPEDDAVDPDAPVTPQDAAATPPR